jgi:hypothetical protein
MALRERGPTVINGRRPRSGRVSDRADPEIRCGDHIPNTEASGERLGWISVKQVLLPFHHLGLNSSFFKSENLTLKRQTGFFVLKL